MSNSHDINGEHRVDEQSTSSKKKIPLSRQNAILVIINLIVLVIASIRPGYPLESIYNASAPIIASIGEALSNFGSGMSVEIDARREAVLDDSEHENCYAYATLDYDTKRVYLEIYDAITSFTETVSVSTTSEDVLSDAYDALTADHGEMFWIKGYSSRTHTRRSEVIKIEFIPLYTMEQSTRDYFQVKINAAVDRILSDTSHLNTDYDKVKFVFDYLASNIEYERESDENQNILSVFLYERSVCQGFASATQYLLRELGVQSAIVTGLANNIPHAWNLVLMDNEYYYVDSTWGNSNFTDENDRYVDYSYFAVTTAENDLTHRADVTFPLPNCRATENNYYMKEGYFFSSYDPEAILNACTEQLEETGTASIKFASKELYKDAFSYLVTQGNIVRGGNGAVYYVDNPSLAIITLKIDEM